MNLTEGGSIIFINDEHSKKHLLSINATERGSLIFVNDDH